MRRFWSVCLCAMLGWSMQGWPMQTVCARGQEAQVMGVPVGAGEWVSDSIVPIVAPFVMPALHRPTFPEYRLSIRQCGARVGRDNRAAIQRTIDRVAAHGGGTVVVPKGQWRTGRIELKSNVRLWLDEGAELHFGGQLSDYMPLVLTRIEGVELWSLGAMIYARDAENIAVAGRGKIVGPTKDCEVFAQHRNDVMLEETVAKVLPVEDRRYDGSGKISAFLPMTFAPLNCRNVLFEGVSVEKTIFWNIVPQYCQNVIVRNVTVSSHGMGRTDGIDIESSENALIEYVTLDCGDDCFTLKSGRGYDGLRVNRPTRNVVIRYCRAVRGAGGITLGSETAAGIYNVYAHDCQFDSPTHGFYFKSRRTRGGGGAHFTFERIRMVHPRIAFKWDMLGSRAWAGELADRLPKRELTPLTPYFEDFTFRDVTVDSCQKVIDVKGIPETPVTQVLIERLQVGHARELMRMNDVDGLVMHDCAVNAENDSVRTEGCKNVFFF